VAAMSRHMTAQEPAEKGSAARRQAPPRDLRLGEAVVPLLRGVGGQVAARRLDAKQREGAFAPRAGFPGHQVCAHGAGRASILGSGVPD